jgi:hypothetical protein
VIVTERHFNTKFLAWLRSQKINGAFELKLTKGKSLPFSALKEHQKEALLAVKHNYLTAKIPDDSIGFKPFDCFGMGNMPAYVVAIFYKPRATNFYLIHIDAWIEFEKSMDKPRRDGGTQSLTEEDALKIGRQCTLKGEKTSFI